MKRSSVTHLKSRVQVILPGVLALFAGAAALTASPADGKEPRPVMTRVPAIAVAALAALAIALIAPLSASASSYRAVAWGANEYGELGDGTETNSTLPLEVKAPREITAVAGGGRPTTTWGGGHSLALLAGGAVLAWGGNLFGELGDGGSEVNRTVPLEVSGLAEVTAIAAGEDFDLALLKDGTVKGWGRNDNGQLGDGASGPEMCKPFETGFFTNSRFPCSRTPVEVKGLKEVTAISAGAFYGLALLKDGTVRAWGSAGLGELGDGSTTGPETCESGPEGNHAACSRSPVEVKGLQEVTAIAAAKTDGLALLRDGTVRAWGNNYGGELGDGSETETGSDVPVEVKDLREVAQLSGGGFFSLALLKDGTVRSWGEGFLGVLGDGNQKNSSVPVEVRGLTGASAVAAGDENGYALLKDGTVRSWGDNGAGQLGNRHRGESNAPVTVKGLKDAVAVAAGADYALALTAPLPTVTGVSPPAGTTTGGTLVTITGTDFAGVTRVMFGSGEAAIKSSTETSIVVESPAGAGRVHVTVTTPYGTSPESGKAAKHAKFKYKRVM